MAQEDEFFPGLFDASGGLNTNQSNVALGRQEMAGYAIELINMEPGQVGYHRIKGFDEFQSTSPTGDGKVIGVAVHENYVYAARVSGANWVVSRYISGSWTQVSTGTLTYATGTKVRHVTTNYNGAQEIIFVDGNTYAQHWTGSTWSVLNGTGAPANPKYVAKYKNRIVLAGASATDSTIQISEPNSSTGFDAASGAAAISVGDTINQIRTFRDAMYIFCDTTIKKLTGSTSADFAISDVTTDMGCLAPDSVVEIGGELVFWTDDGARTIAATDRIGDVEISTLTLNIRQAVQAAVLQHDTRNMVGGIVRGKSQFRYFFSDESGSEPDTDGILGAAALSPQGGAIRWEFSKLYGINPSCFDSGYIDGKEVVVHGGWDGEVYAQESGNNFNGLAILGVYQTPFMDLGDPTLRKTMRNLFSYLDGTSTVTFYLKILYDYEDPQVLQPADYTSVKELLSSKYDLATSIYDNSATTYGGTSSPVLRTPIVGSARTVSVKYVVVDDQQDFSFQGGVIEWEPEGKI